MNIRTRITYCAVITLLSQSVFSQQVRAQQDDAAELIAIIDAVEKGWEQGDGQPFREHFLEFEGAVFIESGGQDAGVTHLIEHHVVPESNSFDGFEVTFSNIDTHVEGNFAWAVADFEYKATVKSDQSAIHSRGYETFLFRRVDGNWMIIHTHSSARPVTVEASHEHAEPHD